MYRSTFFFTTALAWGEWVASRPEETALCNNCVGCWVGPRAGLDDVEKRKFLTVPGLELRSLGPLARSPSVFFLWGYWHCGHSWPIVPASGDSEDDCGEADGM
jgi:hypothetical protein